ncbi:MAG: SusD/RagB family nutrient-binding outer membrane lipoprotein [Flavobacteriales bacterium MED-G22]|nr:MAG: SusD/RagB family nutrient-binding outer membrane lipoprotein [Flavobacteriales bacterium MED-G22]|tara:strand:- start:2632 stop:4065 length:1434 start_codon:yes stop_codon:yes gene_type:complete
MKNYIKKWSLILLTVFAFQACETVDFGDTNVNPNSPSTASTAALLTNAESFIPTIVSEVNSNLMVQYISEITYTEDSRYEQFEWSYDAWYSGPLKDLQEIIDLNTSDPETYKNGGATENQIAVARILKVYFYLYLTDRWGMIPYSEALQGSDNIKPKFDTQEAIYTSLFSEIDESLGSINTSGALNGDLLFNGDMSHWKKFANTLKLVMAMRISNVNQSLGQQKLTEAYNAGVIGSVAENIHYPYLTEDTNDNPWQDRFQTREDYAVSDVFVNWLVDHNDPRIASYAELPLSDATGTYIGCPYGVQNPNVLQSDISFITDDIIYDGTQAGGMIFSYAQVCFSMAEAALRGMTTVGDAETWYNLGIDASMEQWGISAADALSYKSQATVAYDAANGLEQIAIQKWASLYLQGAEAWSEWRRLDFPKLEPAEDALSGNGIPVRNGYAALTKSLNEENYNAAVASQGADTQDTRLWWDTK